MCFSDSRFHFPLLQFHFPITFTEGLCSHVNYTEWSGINALLYYGPTLVAAIGIGASNATGGEGEGAGLIVSGGIGIVQLLAVGPAIVWIDSLGEFALFIALLLLLLSSPSLPALCVASFFLLPNVLQRTIGSLDDRT